MFSNNAIEADRLILEQSMAQIRETSSFPIALEFVEEPEIDSVKSNFDLVLTMSQSEETLKVLDQKFPASIVWNSPAAIRNCYRLAMSNALIGIDVNYVPFQVLKTDSKEPADLAPNTSYWLKRSDFHAICDDDVTLAENSVEATAKLQKFFQRGVKEVLLQKHIHGDIYKFYGVKGKFFRPIKVRSFLNNSPAPDFVTLEKSVTKAAKALGLQIFGGDCVLDANGVFHLIDLNDWPSFRICRDDASKAIASLALDFLSRTVQPTAIASAERI